MYLKNIEDGKRSKTFTEKVVGAVTSEKWGLLREIENLAKKCEMKISNTDKSGNNWGLKNLNEQELNSIVRLLRKIVATGFKGFDAAVYFGQMMQGDIVRIDEAFGLEVSAKDIYFYDENLKKYKIEMDILLKNHSIEIDRFKKETELLNANLDMYKERSDRKSIALKLLLDEIERADELLKPYVSIRRNYDKNKDNLLIIDRIFLDEKITGYENDIEKYRQELIVLKNNLIKNFSGKINKALDLINEKTDCHPQALINGTITTGEVVVDEILEKIKNLLNKKILVVSRQMEEIDDFKKMIEKREIENEELQNVVKKNEIKIILLEEDNKKINEKNTVIRNMKTAVDLRIFDLQRELQSYGIDVMPEKDVNGLIVGVSFSASRYEQNRAQEKQDRENMGRAIAQLKKDASQEGIVLDILPWGDNNYKVIWDIEGLKKNREDLNKKISAQTLLNEQILRKYEKTKQEKEKLEKEIAELVKKSVGLEIEQKTIGAEIDSIFDKLSKYEKNMDRAHIEETMSDPNYMDNFKTKKARNLAHKLNRLLIEKNLLDEKIEEYKQMMEIYEQKLFEIGKFITRSLLLTYYDKTANIFEILTDDKYRFSLEARQLLAVYLCAAADKNGDSSVRRIIYNFIGDRNIKQRAHFAKWLEEQVFPGAFSLVSSENTIDVSVAKETKEYVLLPREEWALLAENPNRIFPEMVLNELLPLAGIVYKNNRNNSLIHLLLDKLLASFDRRADFINSSLRDLIKNILFENNLAKKHEILTNWFHDTKLQKDFVVGKDLNAKNIFINFNPKTSAGFKMAVSDNNKLFELFMKKYLLKYDQVISFLPKQYLFYSDEFYKLLTEENNSFLNNKAKATFFEIFGKDKFAKISTFFDKPTTTVGGYINAAYLAISSVTLFFLVWPSIVLKSASISIGFFSIFLTLPFYLASVYFLFRITGKIKLGWFERREQRFFKKIQKEFTSELKKFKNSEEIVLEFQQRIPLLLLQERERYTICLTGLLKYFMPRTQRNLISVKFMQDNWDDLVFSLMYGSLQGAMGGLPLSVETLQKISELMSMLVILDVLIRDNEQLNLLMGKIRQFYGLKGK